MAGRRHCRRNRPPRRHAHEPPLGGFVDQDTDIPPEGPAEGRGPVASFFTSIAQMLATAIGFAQTRLELLTTELQEEIHRVAEIMVYTVVALLAAGIGL